MNAEACQQDKAHEAVEKTLCNCCAVHIARPGGGDVGKGSLNEGKFAVLGDNRDPPSSQTVHALVSKDQIVGKVVFSIRLRRPESPANDET